MLTLRHRRLVAPFALLVPALFACPSAPYPEARVEEAAQVAVPAAQAPGGQRAATPERLRFSVAAMLSPQDTFESYSQAFALIARRLGVEIEFVQRQSYREVNDLILAGRVDAAMVCTGGWIELEHRAPAKVELIAVPSVGGVTTYRSYVIVPATSRATSLADLAGRRFAFTDELSLTGRAYAVYWLKKHGADPATHFGSVQLTRSHDRSVEAVARGVVDGACVDSLIYDEMLRSRPALGKAVRIIDTSPPFGSPPVVAATTLPAPRRAALREALVGLSRDAEGAKALAAIGIDGFLPVQPSHYDGARAVVESTW
ncbi:MAG TPA: PhnD/SsuA/transferrin family substrate-binding protein [Anaeromyxobacteraceae bacterium]|nr:PhnD/SsuA/transferrin family substrate-binding protein [Anaeromyxobacteraceae bacterium]